MKNYNYHFMEIQYNTKDNFKIFFQIIMFLISWEKLKSHLRIVIIYFY